jgi:3-methyladenine DNA glycosylase AlkC
MAEPFKNLIGPRTVREAGAHLQRVWPAFDRRQFETLAMRGLDTLEFKARAEHLGAALEATLPTPFEAAANVIEAALRPVRGDEPLSELHTNETGLAGWVVWPLSDFVVRRGMDQPARALTLLQALTQRLTAEYAIRHFIVNHTELSLATLDRWSRDASPHVRRLASEGSRPRLPWGLQLRALVADPSPTLPLLRRLQDDPSDYVRRSVANHLNDIAKDHPDVVADWLETHLPGASPERTALLRHASRTLIKRGHPRVLRAWGLGRALNGTAALRIAPRVIELGGSVQLEVALASGSARPQKLVVDYAVHHIKANGSASPKVFKGWALELAPRETRTLTKGHAVKLITTRQYHAGRHRIEVLVNGQVVAEAAFDLKL